MQQCPHCKKVDDQLATRGYCKHCGEEPGAAASTKKTDASRQTSPDQLRCPECGSYSDSIKCYRLATLIFLFAFWVWTSRREAGCPGCMRKKILSSSIVNLFTANVLWPLIILPWMVILFLLTLTKGHSQSLKSE